MIPKHPILDVLIGRDGDGWRLYFAPQSWKLGLAVPREGLFPVGKPDVADLDEFMWKTDSPFERHATGDGGVEILARGRSAVTLSAWLRELITAVPSRGGTAPPLQ